MRIVGRCSYVLIENFLETRFWRRRGVFDKEKEGTVESVHGSP
jgi:hypothetical protein